MVDKEVRRGTISATIFKAGNIEDLVNKIGSAPDLAALKDIERFLDEAFSGVAGVKAITQEVLSTIYEQGDIEKLQKLLELLVGAISTTRWAISEQNRISIGDEKQEVFLSLLTRVLDQNTVVLQFLFNIVISQDRQIYSLKQELKQPHGDSESSSSSGDIKKQVRTLVSDMVLVKDLLTKQGSPSKQAKVKNPKLSDQKADLDMEEEVKQGEMYVPVYINLDDFKRMAKEDVIAWVRDQIPGGLKEGESIVLQILAKYMRADIKVLTRERRKSLTKDLGKKLKKLVKKCAWVSRGDAMLALGLVGKGQKKVQDKGDNAKSHKK